MIDLPFDLLRQIALKIEPTDLTSLKLVCTKLCRAVGNLAEVHVLNNKHQFKTQNGETLMTWFRTDLLACNLLKRADLIGIHDLNEDNLHEIFQKCPNITYLRVDSNEIQVIEFLPEHLQKLNLSGNVTLPKTLPCSLRVLCVYHSKLKSLPPLHATSLEVLDCSDCTYLEVLPSLPQGLKTLIFPHTKITHVPELPMLNLCIYDNELDVESTRRMLVLHGR